MVTFDEAYAADFARLVAEVYALTGSLAEAEDVVQEAFARAWPRWSRVGGYDEPAAWVRRVALNVATSRWRRARRLLPGGHAPEPVERPVEGPDAGSVELVRALGTLPFAQREAVVLHHLADLPVAEVARLTGVPLATAKSRVQRGRARLAELLGDDLEVRP